MWSLVKNLVALRQIYFPISNFSLTKFQTKYLYFHMPKLLYFDIKGSLMQI